MPTVPLAVLSPHGVAALAPDGFVRDLVEHAPGAMAQVVTEQAAALRGPPRALAKPLDKLRNNALVRMRELTES